MVGWYCISSKNVPFQGLMVLHIDGNSEIGAHVWSEIGKIISLRHLFISTSVENLTNFKENT